VVCFVDRPLSAFGSVAQGAMEKLQHYERLEEEEGEQLHKGQGTVPTFFSGLQYVKSTVGVGIFALPYALSKAGVWVGLLVFALIALLAFYTVTLLIAIRVRKGCEDYAACGRAALGTGGVFLANFAVVATQVGTHMVHILFVTGALSSFVPSVPRWAWALALSPLFVLLALIRDVSHMRWPSAAGVLLLLVAVLLVIGFGFANLFPGPVIARQLNHAPVDFFVFFGTSIYVFEGINMAIPIHREMRHPESFLRMFGLVSALMAVVFSLFALAGYIFFLDTVQQIVLSNLTGGVLVAATVIVLLELLLSFPLVFFPIAWAVEKSIAPSFFRPYDAPVFSSLVGWKTNIVRGGAVFLFPFFY
jgi:proton-coupled amino acid transporter